VRGYLKAVERTIDILKTIWLNHSQRSQKVKESKLRTFCSLDCKSAIGSPTIRQVPKCRYKT
jgi:hypothetical protein